MLARPEKTRVEGREMEEVRVRAIIKGRSVPRSPREPESSERGEKRRVERLWEVILRREVLNEDMVGIKLGGSFDVWRGV